MSEKQRGDEGFENHAELVEYNAKSSANTSPLQEKQNIMQSL